MSIDTRHLIAYTFLLLIVLGLALTWHFSTRERRGEQRAWRRYDRSRRKRKADDAAASEA